MIRLLAVLLACAPARVDGDGPLVIDDTGSPTDGGSADGGSGDGGSGDGGAGDGGAGDGGTDGGSGDGGVGDGGASLDIDDYVADLQVTENDRVSTILEVDWTQLAPVDAAWFTFDVEGDLLSTPAGGVDAGAAHQVLLGIPAQTEIALTIHLQVGDELLEADLGSFETGSLPSDLDLPELIILDPTAVDPRPYALVSVDVGNYDFYGPCYAVIIDRQGRVVWYRKTSGNRLTLFPRVSRDGTHLLIDGTSYYVSAEPGISWLTLDRRLDEETLIPGLGFTFDELDDGSVIFDHEISSYDYDLDRLHPDGTREHVWSCTDWMDDYYDYYWACAVNTVLWDRTSNTALWSMFQTSTVAWIDLDSGERIMHFGQVGDGWPITPASAMIDLQHYPNWTPDGTLITTTHTETGPQRQVIREFQVDQDEQTVTQLWSYTPEEGHYGDYAGDVTRLENGNTVIGFGTDGVIQEITPDSEVAWELHWDGHLTGHLTLIDDLYALNEGW